MPITGGAWHWFHQSLINRSGGYGIDGLRGTYFWYLYADPEYTTSAGNKVGAHVELRLREVDTFRSFIDDQVWTWENYAYIQNDDLGKLKAGQLYHQFGLFWDGVFFGNAPYFDGLKLDADYGLSWEKTTEIHDCLKLDSYLQFFFHEDQSNGSFGGADAESVVNYTEKNAGVARLVPTWTLSDGSQLALGASGEVGQIDSRGALPDATVWRYGFDATYTRGPWKAFAEGSQTYGVRNPVSYVSGGPSDQLTNFLAGIHYTRGPVTYRCSYSNSIYENPHAVQNMVLAGATIALTKHVDCYIEYVNQRVDNAAITSQNGPFFHSIEWVINWHF
jgi:predicted porin